MALKKEKGLHKMEFETVDVKSFFEKEDSLMDILKQMKYGNVHYVMDYSETEIKKIAKQSSTKVRTKQLPDNVIAIVCINVEKSNEKIEMIIKNYSKISKMDLIKLTPKFKAKDRNEVLQDLINSGSIQEVKINDENTKTNKPKAFYKWIAD